MIKKKLDKKLFTLKYNAVIKRIRNGKVIDKEVIHNTIVNDGLERIAKLLGGIDSVDDFSYIAIGEDNTAVTNSDAQLGNESKRELATISYEVNYKAKFEKVFTFASGESYAITEAGIFDSVTPSGSTMFNRLVFSAKNVDADTDLSVTITITVGRV